MPDTRQPNAAQQQAIAHDSGPLAVLAGPGTGKTFVIVERIRHMIQTRELPPESILAVSFTVKSAAELRGRLAKVLGAATAERVQSHTFNGYGARLMQRFADVLGLPPRLTMIDAVQRRRLLRDIILTESLFPQSRAEGLDTLIERVEKALEAMANAGKLPAECEKAARAWKKRIVAETAALSEDEATARRLACERFEHEARLYGLFNQRRRRMGLVSYADQIVLPIELLRGHPGPAAIIRSELRAVIVDEFQDCNPGQIELLRLLIGPKVRPDADVCVVGDDDQAIYGFRGGDDRSFQRFDAHWPGATVIPLTENYRSEPPIIRIANEIITRADVRFKPDKVLEFAKNRTPGPGGVEAIKLGHDFDDAEVIAAMILEERSSHGTPPGEIAVIARTHPDLARIAAALTVHDIPFERAGSRTILDDDGVQDVRAWMEWLVDASATWPSLRILSRPPFGLPAEFAAGLDREYRAQVSKFEHKVAGVADAGEYVTWLRGASRRPGPHSAMLAKCLDRYRQLREFTTNRRADEALFRIITTIDAAHSELLPARERAARVTALLTLLTIAREKQSRLAPPGELRQFWEYFEELEEARALTPESAIDAPEDATEAADAPAGGKVQLLTAHASKGLEFPVVFVPRVTPRHGYPKSGDDEPAWNPPPELLDTPDTLDARDEKSRRLDEERRLFFVACTRARRRLVVMARYNKSPSSAVHFLEELVPHKTAPLVDVVRTPREVLLAASQAGVGPASWGDDEAAPQDKTEVQAVNDVKERAQQWAERARRRARLEAAAALETADAAGLGETDLEAIQVRLRHAARILATVSEVERSGVLPAWSAGDAAARAGETLAAIRARAETDGDKDAFALLARPLSPPLELSYTYIKNYLDCPRCFYLRRVMKMAEQESSQAHLGSIIHHSLEEFYKRWSSAENDGSARPGRDVLLSIGLATLHADLAPDQPADRALAEQVRAQLSLAWDNLHDPRANVLELEKSFRFEYPLDGNVHNFTAKLDRLDQLPDSSFRVVDYKTGEAHKYLTDPKADDLQLGIYLLALESVYGKDLPGVAEYWILSRGVRGSLPFGEMKRAKVREVIDGAIRGMLGGDFPRGERCREECVLFDG